MKKTLFLILSFLFWACSETAETEVDPIGDDQDEEELQAKTNDEFINAIGSKLPGIDKSGEHGVASDYEWSSTGATTVSFSGTNAVISGSGAVWENSVLKITSPGTYILSGTSAKAQVLVEPANTDIVKLILNGVTLTYDGSTINVQKSLKTVIIANEGTTNTLTDTKNYTFAVNEDEPDATIFSKKDLSFSGTGIIKVSSNYKDAIRGKDGLIIQNGNFQISSVEDGIKGKDYLVINGGTIDITAGDDGLVASNDSDQTLGYLRIENGNIKVASTDKAIKAETGLLINGGTINVTKSYEALEGMGIVISGGNLNLVASDDGINAKDGNGYSATVARNSDNSNVFIKFSGGTVVVDAGGDGIDSNGSIYQNGGTVLVNGPTANMDGPLDFDNTFRISGGTIIATGSSRMAQVPGSTSTQNSVLINFTSSQAANRVFSIKNSTGDFILTYKPSKMYQSIAYSSPKLLSGAYTISVGGTASGTDENGLYTSGTYTGGTESAFSISGISSTVSVR